MPARMQRCITEYIDYRPRAFEPAFNTELRGLYDFINLCLEARPIDGR
jgi:hypothetical protein